MTVDSGFGLGTDMATQTTKSAGVSDINFYRKKTATVWVFNVAKNNSTKQKHNKTC